MNKAVQLFSTNSKRLEVNAFKDHFKNQNKTKESHYGTKKCNEKANKMSYCEKISSLPSFEHFEYELKLTIIYNTF